MAQAEHQQISPPPRRTHGCLWGCLGVLVLVALIGGGAFVWSGWYIFEGYKNDPALQVAITAVESDRTARDVLGSDIKVTGMKSEIFTDTMTSGRSATYSVDLKGSKAEGKLHVTLHSQGEGMKIVAMVLTGPDGTRYNLTNNTVTPSSSSI